MYAFLFLFVVVDCFGLTDPPNGQVALNLTTFGAVAEYSCEEGYDLIGPTARNCQPNGNWSDNAPVCESKQLTIGRTTMSIVFDLVMLWYFQLWTV